MKEKLALKSELDNLAQLIDSKVQFDSISYDQNTGYLYVTMDGEDVVEPCKIEASGGTIDGLKVEVLTGTTLQPEITDVELVGESNYLVVRDTDDAILAYTVLPATGGGGGGSSYTLRFLNRRSGGTSFSIPQGGSAELQVLFQELLGSDSTGEAGILSVYVERNGTYVLVNQINNFAQSATSSDIKTVDVTEYISNGTTNIRLTIKGGDSQESKSINYTITTVDMYLTSTFNAVSAKSGTVIFPYRCIGRNLTKTVHFIIDGEEDEDLQTVLTTSGASSEQSISGLTHGTHSLEVYFTLPDTTESEHLKYNFMYYVAGTTTPIIAFNNVISSVAYGENLSVAYSVYNPSGDYVNEISLRIYPIYVHGRKF